MKSKRKKPFAATNASIKHLESEGWTCWTVESRIPHTFITRDAFGFADVLAMSPTRGIMLVQVTGGTGVSNFNVRVEKVKAEPRHAIWLASGGRIQIHSWQRSTKDNARILNLVEIVKENP
jgi:hypothetical protein